MHIIPEKSIEDYDHGHELRIVLKKLIKEKIENKRASPEIIHIEKKVEIN